MKTALIALMMAVLTLMGMPVSAQTRTIDAGDVPAGAGVPSDQQWEDVRKKMEAVRMWRLTERLKLDEKTSARLAALLSSIDQKRGALMRENRQIVRDLGDLLKAEKPDEKKMKSAIDKYRKNQEEAADLKKKEAGGLRDILTVQQQAHYLVFQQEFQREMRGMIAGARGKGHGPGKGMRGGMGPGQGPGGMAAPSQ